MIDIITGKKERRAKHNGRRLTVSDISGMEWFTWKGVKYFLYADLFIYSVQCEIAKGRTKEEVLDEMWDIFAQIPHEKGLTR